MGAFMGKYHLLGQATALSVLLSATGWAIDLGPGEPCAAFKFGRIGGGNIVIMNARQGDREVQAETAWTTGVEFDYPLSRYLYAGAALNWQWLGEPYIREIDLMGGGISAPELAVVLKGLISFNDGKLAVKPGFGIGGAQGKYTMFTMQAGVEFQASVSEQFGAGLETGVWYSPRGTDNYTDIRVGPSGYVRGELLFSVWGRSRK